MGLFKNMFGGSKPREEEKVLPWQKLNDVSQLEVIKKASYKKPQFIFKHSTTCGISRMVMNMFTSTYDFDEAEADLYYLDLLSYRDVSTETGHFFQVIHQSPQLIVVKNGDTVAHGSHNGITQIELDKFV